MNNRIFTAIGLIVVLVISPISAYAAATTGANYEVELVVFKHLTPGLEGNEIWSPERINLTLQDLDKSSKPADSTDEKTNIGKAALVLDEHADYIVLSHKRWTQSAEAKSTSPLMRVQTDNGELDGTFVFYMSRFLHIDLKMLLKDMDQNVDEEEGNAEKLAGTNSILAYRIDQSRRIRSKEIHYFDHPKFGVLVQVTPKEKK